MAMPEDPASLVGHVGEHGGGVAEQGGAELRGLDLHRAG